MAIDTLARHRRSEMFRRTVFGTIAVLEEYERQLGDDTVRISSNDLSYMSLKWFQDEIDAFLASEDDMNHLVATYPDALAVLGAAADLSASLPEIRQVRSEVLLPYGDGAKLDRELLERGLSRKDRASLRGLSEAQQATFEAQLDPLGYVLVTKPERERWRRVIRQHLGLPSQP